MDFIIIILLTGMVISLSHSDFNCPQPTGIFANPGDCKTFYICKDYMYIRGTCSGSSYYQPSSQTCELTADPTFCESTTIVGETFQCPAANGYFRDPNNCANYYRCVQNYVDKFKCPPGLFFNTMYQICEDKALFTECNSDGTMKDALYKCPAPNGYFRHATDCSYFYRCLSGSSTLYRCPGDQLFSSTYKVCSSPAQVSDCPLKPGYTCPERNGYFRDRTSCRVYYRCVENVSTKLWCDPGKAFSDDYKTCLPENSVPGCENKKKTTVKPCLNGDGYYPDAVSCEIFYRCFRGEPIAFDCAPGTFFDTKLGTCNHKGVTPGCKPDGRRDSADDTADSGTTNSNTKGTDSGTENFNCALGCGRYPHPTLCDRFLICNGVGLPAKIQKCPNGLAFSIDKLVCDLIGNVRC